MQFIKNVAFLGSSEVKKGDQLYDQAFQIAQLLAENKYRIINGGGPGVMDASTHGAESVGGSTVAITFYPQHAPGFEGRYPHNITDKEIKTGNYIERTFKLMEVADLYIIFKGGTGTFSEFGMAWCLARLYFGVHKPFILFGSFWGEIIDCFKKHMFIRGEEERVFKIVKKPDEILKAIASFEKEFNRLHKKITIKNQEKAFTRLGYRGPEYKIQAAKGAQK
jgi:uncharacterized protein (TIGR00725 family)